MRVCRISATRSAFCPTARLSRCIEESVKTGLVQKKIDLKYKSPLTVYLKIYDNGEDRTDVKKRKVSKKNLSLSALSHLDKKKKKKKKKKEKKRKENLKDECASRAHI